MRAMRIIAIVAVCRPNRIAETANHVVHRSPAFNVLGREAADLFFASSIIVPKLNTAVVQEWHEEAVDRWRPLEAAFRQIEFFNDERMQKAREVGAGGHPHVGKRLFYSAGTANSLAAFEHEHLLPCSCEIGGACQSVVTGSDDNDIPPAGGQFPDWSWEADLSQDSCCCRHSGSLTFRSDWHESRQSPEL